MIVFPNCKINLGLSIKGKRSDGYHNLETVFYPVLIKDILEITTLTNDELSSVLPGDEYIHFSYSGLPIAGDKNDNLCVKAYYLLKKDFPSLPAIRMHLHKVIPMGAGLGGGSSDGAFTLGLLNEKFALELTTGQLIDYAIQLGSDCPFFIINRSCYAGRRGEMLEELNLDLSAYSLVLINPGIQINTGWAFSRISFPDSCQSQLQGNTLKEIIGQPIDNWKGTLVNDFEKPVFEKFPEIKRIKDHLYKQGAIYAAMSGSGSTVFGIYNKKEKGLLEITDALYQENNNYSVFTIT